MKIYLMGIAGTAMASLAGLLQLEGHHISGSDAAVYPPMSDLLVDLKIKLHQPYDETNLYDPPDLVIIGNAISRGNVELEYVLEKRIPFRSMSQVLHTEFLANRLPLVVTGTHGKTTTTSMLAWIFSVAARQTPEWAPSFLIGGVAENFGTSFALAPTKYFLIEGDEYDTAFFDKGPKFLHYFPSSAILTHVEFDHADIYHSLDEVKTAFKRLVNLVPRNGRMVAFDGSQNVTECVSKVFCAVERYGFAANSHWRMADLVQSESGSRWRVFRAGQAWAQFEMPLIGEHNALNATAAAALAAGEGVPLAAITEALKTFESVKRRLEIRDVIDGITIIDDFAHHPTAIRETLRALRARYSEARIWAVLEPRSNTLRRNIFELELVESLSLADEIVLSAVYHSESVPEAERLNPQHVIDALNRSGRPARLLPDVDSIVGQIAPQLTSGDVVAILSNGGFGNIYQKLPAALRSLHP